MEASRDFPSFSNWARHILNPKAGIFSVDIEVTDNRSGRRARANGACPFLRISTNQAEMKAWRKAADEEDRAKSLGNWARERLLEAARPRVLIDGTPVRQGRRNKKKEKQEHAANIVMMEARYRLERARRKREAQQAREAAEANVTTPQG